MSQVKIILKSAVCMVAILVTPSLTFAASWDGEKSKAEHERWSNEIERWETAVSSWFEKRQIMQASLYQEETDKKQNYCNSRGCWSLESCAFFGGYMGECEYRPNANSSSVSGFSLSSIDSSEDNYVNGNSWGVSNRGQVMTFKSVDGRQWGSSNFGQVIQYVNENGSDWKIINMGQVLSFNNKNGPSLESNNYGQVLKYKNLESGIVWESNNYGQVIELTDTKTGVVKVLKNVNLEEYLKL